MLGAIALFLVCCVIGYLFKHRKVIEGTKPPEIPKSSTVNITPTVAMNTPVPTDVRPPIPTPEPTPIRNQEPVIGCDPLEITSVEIVDEHYMDIYFTNRSQECIAITMRTSKDGVNWLSSTAGCNSPRRLFVEDTSMLHFIKAIQNCDGSKAVESNIFIVNGDETTPIPEPEPIVESEIEPESLVDRRIITPKVEVFAIDMGGERSKVAFKGTINEPISRDLHLTVSFNLDNGMNMHIMIIPAGTTIKEDLISLTVPHGFEVHGIIITHHTPKMGPDWIISL